MGNLGSEMDFMLCFLVFFLLGDQGSLEFFTERSRRKAMTLQSCSSRSLEETHPCQLLSGGRAEWWLSQGQWVLGKEERRLEGATVLPLEWGSLQGSIHTPMCRDGWEEGGSCLGSQCTFISAQHIVSTQLSEASLA